MSIILYADDIVLLSDSEVNLQCMLDYLNEWCQKWSLNINCLKSNIVHFRPKTVFRSTYHFKCGVQNLEIIDRYTYLGVILDEYLTFSYCIKTHSLAGSRALSSLINKHRVYNNSTLFYLYLFAIYSELLFNHAI